MQPKYKRILLKLSGESLAGENKHGIDFDTVVKICEPIKKCVDAGVQVGIVVGGGNFWRGRSSGDMDRTRADHMGMLATAINALGVADALESLGVDVRVQTAITMRQVAEPYIRSKAVRHLDKGRVVIFGCGTGNPFFSTDTAAALRAVEIEADVIMKATMVDGVYDSDPKKNPNAKRYDNISFQDVLSKNLAVMDSTASALCMDNDVAILVFSIDDPENIYKAVCGENIGTVVENKNSRQSQGRLLRNPHSGKSACRGLCYRGKDSYHPALGRFYGKADRKGYPEVRYRHQPHERRQGHPPYFPASDRGQT